MPAVVPASHRTGATAPAMKRARGRPRKTEDARDDGNRRQALLQAAARLFRRQGFAATTTRDIAAAAGMQSGSPFYHFKSKQAMLQAVIEEGMRSALARQQQLDTEPGFAALEARAQLRRRVRAHFETLLGAGNDFIPVMLYEQRALTPSQRRVQDALVAEYEALWTAPLQALVDAGVLRVPVGLTRLFLLGAMNWSVQWFDARKGASLDELTEVAMQLFFKEPA